MYQISLEDEINNYTRITYYCFQIILILTGIFNLINIRDLFSSGSKMTRSKSAILDSGLASLKERAFRRGSVGCKLCAGIYQLSRGYVVYVEL